MWAVYSSRYAPERHWLPCVEPSGSSDGVEMLSVSEATSSPDVEERTKEK